MDKYMDSRMGQWARSRGPKMAAGPWPMGPGSWPWPRVPATGSQSQGPGSWSWRRLFGKSKKRIEFPPGRASDWPTKHKAELRMHCSVLERADIRRGSLKIHGHPTSRMRGRSISTNLPRSWTRGPDPARGPRPSTGCTHCGAVCPSQPRGCLDR